MSQTTFARTLARAVLQHAPIHQRGHLLRNLGLLAGFSATLAGYAFLREPLRVKLDRLTIRLPSANGHLPPNGLRILHLSDTHFCGKQWREQPKIDSIRRACAGLEYDLLIHTGDFVHEDSGLPNVLALLDSLPKPRLGSFAVFGNHDYTTYSHSEMLPRAWAKFTELHQSQLNGNGHNTTFTHLRTFVAFGHYFANSRLDFKRTGRNNVSALEAALLARNIYPLHNRSVRLICEESGVNCYLAGVDDVCEGAPDLQTALQDVPDSVPVILLTHNPDILTEPGVDRADLVLAGHTHGGQIVLPLVGAAHTQTDHLHRNEVSGYLRRGKTQIYITRGIGEGIPLRFRAAPQITLITVLPDV